MYQSVVSDRTLLAPTLSTIYHQFSKGSFKIFDDHPSTKHENNTVPGIALQDCIALQRRDFVSK